MPANVEWMVSGNRQVPWHGIGEVVDGTLSGREALRLSRLNYSVETWPVQAVNPATGQVLQFGSDNRATVRVNADGSTQLLARVGGQYEVFQNADLFALAEAILQQDDGVQYETAGILDEGRRVFILARLPEDLVISSEDKVRQYLALANSHDGSMEAQAFKSDIRIVCKNTLRAAQAAAEAIFTIRHTGSMEERAQEAARTLRIAYDYGETFRKLALELAGVPFDLGDMTQLAYDLYPEGENGRLSKQSETAHSELKVLFGVENTRTPETANTAWAAWNVVGERLDHKPTAVDPDRKLSQLWWGVRAEKKEEALVAIAKRKGIELPKAMALPLPESQ